MIDDLRRAPAALRARLPVRADRPRLAGLLSEAADHLERVLIERPAESLGVLAVPVAVHRAVSPMPVSEPVLTAAAATYLALDVLDDQMDGDRPSFWSDRGRSEVIIGAQILLLTAADALGPGYQDLMAAVAEGQLGTEVSVTGHTSPAEVATVIEARSGALLAGFAARAAALADAPADSVIAARRFGRELGIARQHVNDLTELVGSRPSDLRNGTATMAVALALQTRDAASSDRLLSDLQIAADDPHRRAVLVARDLAGAISEVRVLVLLHLQQAREAAHVIRRASVGDDDLDRLIEHTAVSVGRTS